MPGGRARGQTDERGREGGPPTGWGGRRRRWWTALAVVALVAGACSSDGGADPPSGSPGPGTTAAPATEPAVAYEPEYEPAEACPMPIPDEVEVEVECGWVTVPENRLDPGTRTIRLAVARLRSRSATPAPDPVVNLSGGPGFSALDNVAGSARSAILDTRDYIIWDQRGLGFSEPNLDCHETNEAVWGIFATTDPAEVESARIRQSLRECRDRLAADGVDFAGYTTVQNAADLNDIRIALGIDAWHLRGVSYGSALAIETVRNHPEGLRSALLDSLVVPDEPFGAVGRGESALRAFAELAAACAAQEACAGTYGDLTELIARAAAALDAEPHRSTIVDPRTGEDRPIAITGGDLYAGLFNAMYDASLIPVVPGAVQAIADGERGIIDVLAAEGIPFAAGQHEGMTAAVTCADRGGLLEPGSVEPFVAAHPELGALVLLMNPEDWCADLGVDPAPAPFNELLTATDVPILVMAGQFDPITPPEGSRRVAEALGLELVLFPNAGHGGVSSSPCSRDIWFAFLDDPSSPPDTACIADLAPPSFG